MLLDLQLCLEHTLSQFILWDGLVCGQKAAKCCNISTVFTRDGHLNGTFPAGWSERLIQMAKCQVFIWSEHILIIKIFFFTSQQIINDQK